jgi:hypothetical protein
MNLDALFGDSAAPEMQCSRKGCSQQATTRLLWNNPKIHTPERRKVWLGCADHADWLENYLTERGLFRSREDMP